MTFELRTAIIGLAAFAAVGLFTALLVPSVAGRVNGRTAAVRARRLASLRLLPSALALVAAALAVASFVAFESRRPDERVGTVLPILASCAAALLLAAAWRAIRIVFVTRRMTRGWLANAEPIALDGVTAPAFVMTSDFPVVAVAGVVRPRLFIARSVLSSCSPEELHAILAHEQGHIDRRDNLRRLLLAASPDVLAWLPASSRILTAWREAAEEAADDDAAHVGAEGRVRLAGALIKLAKLARPGVVPKAMPASTLYCGERLDRRVRRLLDPRVAMESPAAARWRRRLVLLSVLPACAFALKGVHEAIEVAIHTLP